MKLDKWQNDVLRTHGNMAICAGRQSGKSTIISQDAGEYALRNPKKTIMIIAAVERSAFLLFEKVLEYIYNTDKNQIKVGKDRKTGKTYRPTKHTLHLKNGSIIHCLPTGDDGYGIRGFTIDRLYADEAAFIKEAVWAAVTPMLATTGGDIILLSTPMGIENYFYRMFHSDQFTSFHINAEEVAEGREEPMRTNMINHQAEEKLRMTKLQYQQEYLGLFVGGIQRLFSDVLIDACCTIDPEVNQPSSRADRFLGIDIARKGGDETVLCSVSRINRENIEMFDLLIPEPQSLTDTARLIVHKDRQFNYKKIYIDDGGLGVGVFDILLEDRQTKNKIVGLNNAKKDIDKENWDKLRKKSINKVNFYTNLKILMERGQIKLLDLPEVKHSLRSIQYDDSEEQAKIFGNYSHIAEALIRAAWCTKDKSLNIYIY